MKKSLFYSFAAFILTFSVSCGFSDQKTSSLEMRGADISFYDEINEKGGSYKIKGKEVQLFDVLKQADVNWIRLRLWVNPEKNYCNLEHTLKIAKSAKQAGFKLLLDFHYSDSWADPSQQTVPSKWSGLTLSQLESKVSEYTKDVLDNFMWNECLPDMVQVGNEITNGMLWPYGSVNGGNTSSLMTLVSSGCNTVRDISKDIKIMLHLDSGADLEKCEWWFDEAEKYGIDFDVIGLSYYPFFHGTDLDKVSENIPALKKRFSKEVVIAETSYPWTFSWNDNTQNQVGEGAELIKDCPATVSGQKKYLKKMEKLVIQSGGKGLFWWEPDSISTEGFENALENQCWFDFDGNWNGTGF